VRTDPKKVTAVLMERFTDAVCQAPKWLKSTSRETVWKVLRAGHPPHHKPPHRHVNEGLTCGTQPPVVFGHPSVVAYPGEGTLHPGLLRTRKPFGGIRLCQSSFFYPPLPTPQPGLRPPSLVPAFGACAPLRRSTPKLTRLASCPSPGSRRPITAEKGAQSDPLPASTAA
jgi:hypothetical protein